MPKDVEHLFLHVFLDICTSFCYFNFLLFIYSHVHTLFESFLPPAPLPHPLLHFQAEPVLPLSLILLERRHKHNKEVKVFLLVELRIGIQKDS
jgi:hypothetical protein